MVNLWYGVDAVKSKIKIAISFIFIVCLFVFSGEGFNL